jgi:hypothetical protein
MSFIKSKNVGSGAGLEIDVDFGPAAERMLLGASGSLERVTATVREMDEAWLRRVLDEQFGAT